MTWNIWKVIFTGLMLSLPSVKVPAHNIPPNSLRGNWFVDWGEGSSVTATT